MNRLGGWKTSPGSDHKNYRQYRSVCVCALWNFQYWLGTSDSLLYQIAQSELWEFPRKIQDHRKKVDRISIASARVRNTECCACVRAWEIERETEVWVNFHDIAQFTVENKSNSARCIEFHSLPFNHFSIGKLIQIKNQLLFNAICCVEYSKGILRFTLGR